MSNTIQDANSAYVQPSQMRHLRACMVCSLLQLTSKFISQGCPNCEGFLALQGSDERVRECTSQVYEGMITLRDPSKSWVAKWNRLDGYVPGVYATKVTGVLPEEVVQDIEEAGVRYIPRDGSAQEEEAPVPAGPCRSGVILSHASGQNQPRLPLATQHYGQINIVKPLKEHQLKGFSWPNVAPKNRGRRRAGKVKRSYIK